jgi:hypothetical protein
MLVSNFDSYLLPLTKKLEATTSLTQGDTGRKQHLDKARKLLKVNVPIVPLEKEISGETKAHEPAATFVCPCCGAGMIVTDVLLHLYLPRAPPLLLK